jgi:hypothetical protein
MMAASVTSLISGALISIYTDEAIIWEDGFIKFRWHGMPCSYKTVEQSSSREATQTTIGALRSTHT